MEAAVLGATCSMGVSWFLNRERYENIYVHTDTYMMYVKTRFWMLIILFFLLKLLYFCLCLMSPSLGFSVVVAVGISFISVFG
ncbi:hypothetical protein LguiA_007205 [Lonicera macranthoides]